MKNHFIILFVIFIPFLFTGCKKTASPTMINKEKVRVEMVLEKYILAIETEDLAMAKKVWAPLTDIVVIGTSAGEILVGWQAIEKTLRNQFAAFDKTYVSVSDQDIKFNKSGSTAWFSETVNYNFIYKEQAQSFEGVRFTGVLEQIEGEWYIVQSHMSVPYKEIFE